MTNVVGIYKAKNPIVSHRRVHHIKRSSVLAFSLAYGGETKKKKDSPKNQKYQENKKEVV